MAKKNACRAAEPRAVARGHLNIHEFADAHNISIFTVGVTDVLLIHWQYRVRQGEIIVFLFNVEIELTLKIVYIAHCIIYNMCMHKYVYNLHILVYAKLMRI